MKKLLSEYLKPSRLIAGLLTTAFTILFFVFIIAPILGLTVQNKIEPQPTPTASFKLHTYKNQLVIKLYINGDPAYFIVDTGAELSVMDSAQADNYDMMLLPQKRNLTGIGNTPIGINLLAGYFLTDEFDNTYQFNLKSANVSNCVHEPFTIKYSDHLDLTIMQEQGIIGADFLKKYNAVIDYKNLTLNLYK